MPGRRNTETHPGREGRGMFPCFFIAAVLRLPYGKDVSLACRDIPPDFPIETKLFFHRIVIET